MNPIDKFCSIVLMVFSILAIFLALFFTLPCKAETWTTEQKQLADIATTLIVVDWAQTRHIANNPHKFHEEPNMSRNSKGYKRTAAKHKKGPAKTTPKHGKTKAWWQTHLSYSAWFNGGKHELAQRNTNHNVQQ